MPALQSLKKQLRGIRSPRKLTKAMKTVATVKFSQLNAVYGQYAAYGNECLNIYRQHSAALLDEVRAANPAAPAAVVVMAANKGLCGGFNAELLSFASEELEKMGEHLLFVCGKQAVLYFREKGITMEENYVFPDVPEYAQSCQLLDELIKRRREGTISRVYVIYPHYANMMVQTPTIFELFPEPEEDRETMTLFVPEQETVVRKAAKTIFRAMLHRLVLETATGAQAATLMTMRSAYDTATDYCEQLEGQINRKRQSAVTADVLETSSERSED